ncbi:MAG TPA: DUF4249 family protein [Chitinophagales bacterium]|nr:DUF4249 family protein [Chitinophagales bacterium]
MFRKFLLILFIFTVIISCEKEISVDLPLPKDQIVVEGFIENDVPPYVFLTKNSPYFGEVDINDLDQYFVKGAKIIVSTGTDSVELMEYSADIINLLPEEEKQMLSEVFGVPLDTSMNFPNISIYTVPLGVDFVGVIGKTYDLRIEAEGKLLTATTYIPHGIAFSKLWVEPHPNPIYDTLVQLRGILKDPDTLGNFYRYFTKKNSQPYTLINQSVFDDLIYNGKEFPIDIPYGFERNSDVDFDFKTFGYWNIKDTCYIKLCMIDRAHYNFWRTLENELANQGSPFGSFTRIRSNINGGIGIWGGYSSSMGIYYPEE